jgi:Peptidase_C39 like family
MTLLTSQEDANQLKHRLLTKLEKEKNLFVWEETLLRPFDELIISWNAKRPLQGAYLIQASLLITEWSPWMDYAFWGAHSQYTFKESLAEASLKIDQDIIEVLEGKKAHGFKIRIIATENVSLEQFHMLHISATDSAAHEIDLRTYENVFIDLQVPICSQMSLPDERRFRLCSPTATTAVINFLSNSLDLSPLQFADAVKDVAFDMYGNWILNTAQASCQLEKPWHCFVARLTSFNQIINQLKVGYPVVVSIKGPLNGSALPYESGHLLVVKGYDSKKQRVFCMDPAFPTDELTEVSYDLNDFLIAWGRRMGIAYIFART